MKTLITTLILILLAGSALAAPFLSSNSYTGTIPAYFMLSIDGGTAVQSTPGHGTGPAMGQGIALPAGGPLRPHPAGVTGWPDACQL